MNLKFLTVSLLAVLITISCNQQNAAQVLKPLDFQKKINSTQNIVVLDVRTKEEVQSGFIENAINIDYNNDEFKNEIAKLDKNNVYAVYCLSGLILSGHAASPRPAIFVPVVNNGNY